MSGSIHGMTQRLVSANLVTDPEAQRILDQSRLQNISPVTYLIDNQLLEAKTIATITAAEFALPLMDLDAYDRHYFGKSIVDPRLIRKHRVLPVFRSANQLLLAVADPSRNHAIDEIKFHTGLSVKIVLVEHDKLNQAIDKLLDFFQPTKKVLQISPAMDAALPETPSPGRGDTEAHEDASDDPPLIGFVNKIMHDAVKQGASDIHFEPYEKTCRLRFRIDGILHEVSRPPINIAARITARIKILSRMDIAEKRIPQDGRINLKLGSGCQIDVRVNTLPTLWGEKVVLRLLNSAASHLEISSLGLDPLQQQFYKDALQQPQGMILVTGPTGCGKSMSLYAGLKLLNTAERNISTAENPVEMAIEGINQVQVNNKTGLGFATALRAFLRQDPDVVMVGEIRDLETAEIAIKASQTGHLVLSTLHTNSAAETLSRLRAMGIPAFNIATSVTLIIAQRLIRRLCDNCKERTIFPENTLIDEGFTDKLLDGLTVFRAVGCDRCTAGYLGRIGIYEVVPINPCMSRIIMADGNTLQIAEQMQKVGLNTLRQSALSKVARGLTSLDEANRLT
ncbi:MAG: type IV-A pilus assembly ATPase PilB [Pseudohongiellaceae bacterium]